MDFDTLLFDLDGTLVDSLPDLRTAVNLLRGELDLPPLDAATVRSYVGDGATLLVQRALPANLYREERLRRFLDLYGEHLLEQTVVYPGILDFLELHRERKLAVVTNKPYRLTLALLEGIGLAPYFQAVLGGDSCEQKKPHPAPVLAGLDATGSAPAGSLMIGDHHTDLLSGQAAGVKTCFCAWGLGHDGGLPSDFRADSPLDLPRIFPGGRR